MSWPKSDYIRWPITRSLNETWDELASVPRWERLAFLQLKLISLDSFKNTLNTPSTQWFNKACN